MDTLEMKMQNKITKIVIFILGIIIILGISLNIDWFESVERNGSIIECFMDAYNNQQTIIWGIFFAGILLWMWKLFEQQGIWHTISLNKRVSIVSAVFSIVFAFFEVAGNSLQKVGSFYILHCKKQYFLMSILKFTGFFILFWMSLYTVYLFIQSRKSDLTDGRIWKILSKKRYAMLFFILCWFPYVLVFYPCSTAGDTFDQIRQFFNKPVHDGLSFQWSTYYDMVELISNEMLINQHHPVMHTILIGVCIYIGHALGNDNFGLFLYVLFQTVLTSSILAYILVDCSKLNINVKFRKIMFLLYAFVPVFPVWIITICKDSLHAPIFFLYVYVIVKISHKGYICKIKWKEYLAIILVQFFLVLTKSTGIYIIFLSSIFFFIKKMKMRKELLISMLMVCFVQIVLLQGLIYPFLKISPGGGQEVWSVPCNQIGRYVKEYGDTITKEDGDVINKLIYYDYCAEWYDEDNADHIKNSFHIDATIGDKIEFIKVWWKYFCKHPEVYIVACADLCYQYFYPQNVIMNPDNAMGVSYVVSEIEGFEFYNCGIFNKFLPNIVSMVNNLVRLPVLGMLVSSGFYVWILFIAIGLMLLKGKKMGIMPFIPVLIYILILVAGPRYLTRYALILFYTVPFLVANELSEGIEN